MPPKRSSTLLAAVAGDLERLDHDVRAVVADRARATARCRCRRCRTGRPGSSSGSCVSSASSPPCGIENGLWREGDLLRSPRPTRTSGSRRSSRSGRRPRSIRPSSSPTWSRTGPASFGRRVRLVADEEHGVAGADARQRLEPRQRARRRGTWRSGPSAVAVVERRPSPGPARPRSARTPTIWSKKLRGWPAASGAGIARTTRALLDGAGEDLEVGAAEDLGDVGDLERVAQVRLVGAVVAASPRGRGCAGTAAASPCQSRRTPRTRRASPARSRANTSSCVDEAHLEVELVELAGRAVGAGVLVAEAGRDLEVAVEAGDHQQLLELLRRLRQRVELAGVQPATAPGSRARPRASSAVRIGVWNSVKPCSIIRRRMLAMTCERSMMLRCIFSRRRSRKR